MIAAYRHVWLLYASLFFFGVTIVCLVIPAVAKYVQSRRGAKRKGWL